MNNTDYTSALESISGSIERITFYSSQTGFCVLKVKVQGHTELITITGNTAAVNVGEHIDCEGSFVNDKIYGKQFKANKMRAVLPGTIEGIEKYLASGLVKGIGPHFAKKLVQAFGQDLFSIAEEHPEKLLSLSGVGKSRLQSVLNSLTEQKVIREIMIFLQSHGISTARAVRIYKTYGNDAIAKVSSNPYQLALDIHGIGFNTADNIALKLGIARDSIMRAQAAVRHVLQEASAAGHCACLYEELVQKTSELLVVSQQRIEQAIEEQIRDGHLVLLLKENRKLVFLKSLFTAEQEIAHKLIKLKSTLPSLPAINFTQALKILETTEIRLANSQIEALKAALTNKLLVVTGGPGVGKTTLVKSLLQILGANGAQIALCAPTGRAAKRLSETTGQPARTIHRLLEFNPEYGGFFYNKENPLPADAIIVDEASMIDVVLMNKLLEAVPDAASLILVGDVDQLPSVGPGAVLSDIITCGAVQTVCLTEIFRQAASSKVITNAHRINQGLMPELKNDQEELSDFYFIQCSQPTEILHRLITVVCERIPKRFGFNPIKDIQVITPMNKGLLGSQNLNSELQKHLNPQKESQATDENKTPSRYYPGDKVIQLINNYKKEIFNGDIGTISSIADNKSLIINFEGRFIEYEQNELDEINLAYAISVHKSQGSEYSAVVIPVSTAHYTMLERKLFYTGVTRGKKLVVLIGESKALAMAIKNRKNINRLTALKGLLKELDIEELERKELEMTNETN